MKHIFYIILISVIGLTSCKKGDRFTIKANLADYQHDYLFVVYDDPVSKVDTIYPQKGKFAYEIVPDTINMFRLLSPDGDIIPVIADKGDEMEIAGTMAQPVIKTKGNNKLYAEFLESTNGMDDKQTTEQAEKFIKANPQSFVSAYLIDQYFVQIPNPDLKKAEALIAPLNGNIKDCRILSMVLRNLSEKKNWNNNSEVLPYISCKDRNNKFVSWSTEEGCYTLVNIWASWNEESVAAHDSIYKIAEKLPEGKFRVLNLSLDYDKKAWLRKCKKDSKKWIESCDFKGWGMPMIKQEQITKFPTNILIDRNRKKLAYNLYDDALYKEVKQRIDSDDAEKKNKKK